ncbi:MAG: hypothetical protein CL960_05280 [Euryarchaeota archaeon]|nr:hypothetical protein [Euryarchaeota archaeon]MDP6363968.1 ATP-binding protein [Candidatus Poseidoniia archaeon]MDP6658635.1 ATP-binding protein [Candidatus Poseidoniia archaeon]MDP6846796.1 ATP-binding protein [Candidatus Poseidoniia archaeon]MDP7006588.1 ATP-binding protein [Candidatus Poseidoniia archaeon]
MSYVMVTGPMGAGKSTLMRSLPEQASFAPPPGVPEMFLDHACSCRTLQLYEIDEPTALGARWADWLRAADAFLLIATAAAGPESVAPLLAHLRGTCPETPCLLVASRWPDGSREAWELPGVSAFEMLAPGTVLDEDRALAEPADIERILARLHSLLEGE